MGTNPLGISKELASIRVNKNELIQDHLLRETTNLETK